MSSVPSLTASLAVHWNGLDPWEPYDSERMGWTSRDAIHLLWRTQFGASPAEIEQATADGLDATLDRLLTPQPEKAEFESSDRLLRQIAIDTGDIDNLKAWWLFRMLNSANPLAEKLSLFWHNHFATSNAKVRSVRHMAAQNDLIRRESLGSFRNLLSSMARDVAMLIWLDSNANRKRHPNENFAREVMELFSLGVGNYTEQDILEAARAFTGWHVRNDEFWFNPQQHDKSRKTVLGRSGDLDGDDVLDICLAQPACPRFLAAKLLSTFVTPDPAEVLVEQLAGRIREHDFEMRPVLREVFGSRMFFEQAHRQALIKSPLELVLGACRVVAPQPNLRDLARTLKELGQDVFEPPTVKGWEGGRLWINSATMLQRANFVAELTNSDHFAPAELGSEPITRERIGDVLNLLLARDLSPMAMLPLQSFLDKAADNARLQTRGLVHLIMTMPEYQLV